MVTIEQVPAYVVWPIRHKVMYPQEDFDFVKLPDDERGTHLALFAGNDLLSVISLFQKDSDLQFRKFATKQEFQGRGYGSELLRHVIQYARQQGTTRIWCNARTSAIVFYSKFGFRPANKTFTKNGIDYTVMELRIS